MPKVSVIVPFYNVEPYIERCARSLFGQTLEDMEYIFVDDCSTDNSVSVLKSVLTHFPCRESSTKIICLEKNSGQAKALHEGLKHITGDFFIKCDGDDEIDLDTYERMYQKAISDNLDIVICDFVQLYPDGSSVYMGQHIQDDMVLALLTDKISTSVCNKLVKREVFDQKFVYPTMSMCEDFVFSMQYFYRYTRIGSINEPFYKYYRYPSSFLAVSEIDKYLQKFYQLVDNMNKVFSIVASEGDEEKYRDYIVAKKLKTKNFLLKYIGSRRIYKLWKSTFSEINCSVLGCSAVTKRNKIFYVMTCLRLYPLFALYKKLRNK